jgi:hypothetical protein
MIKEYSFGSKHVNAPTNNISSWRPSSRGTIFTSGADIEARKQDLWSTEQELEVQ